MHDKLAEKLAEVKFETHEALWRLAFEAEALMDTPPARLTNVKIETQRDSGSKIRIGVYQ